MKCRHCLSRVSQPFMDLGASPPSNAYLSEEALSRPESYFPLRVLVCTNCWLVQTEDFARADELFTGDYAYFSSVTQLWLEHAESYMQMITNRLDLGMGSFVLEVAANDGYLLKNFVKAGIPCLGIEPTVSTALAAEKCGVPIIREFFSSSLAKKLVEQGNQADLIVGNNVYAHVPDINDFTAGLRIALKPSGVVTLEFPHLMRLIEFCQFDTLYHEHFSYLSLHAVAAIFKSNGLRIFDVDELSTHGGSLRVYACHQEDSRETSRAVGSIFAEEQRNGLLSPSVYEVFQRKAERIKDELLYFLISKRREGSRVAAYGAAAKGNTLLNFAGVKADLIPFVCDSAPSKKGKYMPGSRIPILDPSALREHRPDYVVILPWNIAAEVVKQHNYIKEWGGRFVTLIPSLLERS